jgi:hypothetical protein
VAVVVVQVVTVTKQVVLVVTQRLEQSSLHEAVRVATAVAVLLLQVALAVEVQDQAVTMEDSLQALLEQFLLV